jgi:hypothetical protein
VTRASSRTDIELPESACVWEMGSRSAFAMIDLHHDAN